MGAVDNGHRDKHIHSTHIAHIMEYTCCGYREDTANRARSGEGLGCTAAGRNAPNLPRVSRVGPNPGKNNLGAPEWAPLIGRIHCPYIGAPICFPPEFVPARMTCGSFGTALGRRAPAPTPPRATRNQPLFRGARRQGLQPEAAAPTRR